MAGYQAANADQDERSHGSEDGKAIKPMAVHEMASLRMSLIYRINNNARRSVPEEADTPRVRMTIYLASRLKSTFAGAPSFTSISCMAMPALRCAAWIVYLPAGTLPILKEPSLSETAK